MLVFSLGALIVYLVLSAQSESYVTPVIILATVPLAMLWGLAFLAMRSIDLNIYAQVSLATLIGLVVATVLSLGMVRPVYVLVKTLNIDCSQPRTTPARVQHRLEI